MKEAGSTWSRVVFPGFPSSFPPLIRGSEVKKKEERSLLFLGGLSSRIKVDLLSIDVGAAASLS
jgi:hypothetical protein